MAAIRRSVLAVALTCAGMLAASIPAAEGALAAGLPGGATPAAPAIPQPPTQLYGVYCTSAANCWAVGEVRDGSADANQILHWNGKTWRGVLVPNPAGASGDAVNELYAVRCQKAKDCWAVGATSKNASTTYFAEALHWNGKRWSSKPVPHPGGTGPGDATFLSDSICVSATNCWAVGSYGFDESVTIRLSNLVLHWNGKKWSKAAGVPNPAGTGTGRANYLAAVRCFSATSCIAAGENLFIPPSGHLGILNEALRWNGKRWSKQSTPNPGGTGDNDDNQLVALACGSSKSCWGVGYYGGTQPTQTSLNEILHWNGTKWVSAKSVPDPGGTSAGAVNQLEGATCSSSGNCWALGSYTATSGATLNEALHWNGSSWRLVKTPDPGGTVSGDSSILNAVRCTSASNCWAVGSAAKGNGVLQNEILHWTGRKWTTYK
jgi:hypothetical protein